MKVQILFALMFVFGWASTLSAQLNLTFEHVSSAFERPVFATVAPGDSERMFVIESHTGRIRIMNLSDGSVLPTPFLTVTGMATGGEQGLLGLAFHPDYASNGRFFVNYNDSSWATVIAEYQRVDANTANPVETRLLTIPQPSAFHNGGWMDFGPDGFLYISTGDGDIPQFGQDKDNLLGKMLRLDVDRDDFPADPQRNYGIPATNPFVGQEGADEVFAYGLRNPWRCSFDRLTGDIYIADVGEGAREEIDILRAGSPLAHNFGWDIREGTLGGPKTADMVDPIYEYGHDIDGGFSVTGGYVYRGPISSVQGHYFCIDFVTNNLWSFKFDGTANPGDYDGSNMDRFINWSDHISTDVGAIANLASFAEDAEGNLYTVGLGGSIFRLVDAVVPPPIQVTTVQVVNGLLVSGDASSLETSDNMDLVVRRNSLQTNGVVTIDFEATTSVSDPVSFEFCLEAAGFFRSNVVQTIQFYDFDQESFVEVSSGPASRFTDRMVRVDGVGDLSRFVEDGSGAIRTRVVFSSAVRRQQFSTATDKAVWIVN